MKFYVFLAIVIICTAVFFGRDHFSSHHEVYDNQDSTVVNLSPGERIFTIALSGHAGSTGYSWYLKNFDSEVVIPVKQSLTIAGETEGASKQKIVGAPTMTNFTFKVVSPRKLARTTEIGFVKIQPWIIDVDSEQRRTYRVSIN